MGNRIAVSLIGGIVSTLIYAYATTRMYSSGITYAFRHWLPEQILLFVLGCAVTYLIYPKVFKK